MRDRPQGDRQFITRLSARGRREFAGENEQDTRTAGKKAQPGRLSLHSKNSCPHCNDSCAPDCSCSKCLSHHHTGHQDTPPPPPKPRTPVLLIIVSIFIFIFGVLILLGLISYALQVAHDNGYDKRENELYETGLKNAPLVTDMVEADIYNSSPWITSADGEYVAKRKLQSLLVETSYVDQRNLAIFETFGRNRKMEGALHSLLGTVRGDKESEVLLYQNRNLLNANHQKVFQDLYKINGSKGYMELGQYYLNAYYLSYGKRLFGETDYYRVTQADQAPHVFRYDYEKAYSYFHIAYLCNEPEAAAWRNQAAQAGAFNVNTTSNLQSAATNELEKMYTDMGVTREAFCSGSYLKKRLAFIEPSMIVNEGYDDYSSSPSGLEMMTLSDLVTKLSLPEERFRQFLVQYQKTEEEENLIWAEWPVPSTPRDAGYRDYGYDDYGYGDSGLSRRPYTSASRSSAFSDGSRYFRDSPGGGMPGRISEYETEEALANCRVDANSPECRKATLACADDSRYYFNLGEAAMAKGAIAEARRFFTRAINSGRICASEYAVMASKRLGALNLTCEYDAASLAQISRGTAQSRIIDLRIRQNALKSLGYYRDTVDGKYGPATREAVSEFQEEFGFRQTGDLSPLETVYLVCGAAEIARDIDAYSTLGVMYILGHGVVQNTDMGLQWLRLAARDGNSDAKYNLALIYGTGVILGSYQVCDVVESTAQADAWLEEAARDGHPVATRLVRRYAMMSPEERWLAIAGEIVESDSSLDLTADRCSIAPAAL